MLSGIAPQLTGTNFPRPAAALRVQRPGDQLLAGSALAGDEHGAVRLRELCHDAQYLLHQTAGRDDLATARVDLRAQVLDLARQRRSLGGALHGNQEPRLVERLRQVVVGACLDSVHGVVDGGERGDEDDFDVGPARLDRVEQGAAVGRAIHANVGQYDVDVGRREHRRRLLGIRGLVHDVAVLLEQDGRREADIRVIVDEEDFRGHAVPTSRRARSVASGIVNVTRAPRFSRLSTTMAPLWLCTICPTTTSPSPVP